jgi:hypothetical protein
MNGHISDKPIVFLMLDIMDARSCIDIAKPLNSRKNLATETRIETRRTTPNRGRWYQKRKCKAREL